jgi:hypothetical protein
MTGRWTDRRVLKKAQRRQRTETAVNITGPVGIRCDPNATVEMSEMTRNRRGKKGSSQ